jgi:hypothetical protein
MTDPQPTIRYPDDHPMIALPDDTQRKRLAQIVAAKYPLLGPDLARHHPRWHDQELTSWQRQFDAAFRRIAALRRDAHDKLDERGVRIQAVECEEWLKHRGLAIDIGWPAFLVAAVAAGDVAFCLGESSYSTSTSLRLDSIGRVALPAWKAVLEGRMRELLPVTSSRDRPRNVMQANLIEANRSSG